MPQGRPSPVTPRILGGRPTIQKHSGRKEVIPVFNHLGGDGPALARPPAAQDTLDHTVLPIAEPKPPTYAELDARNAEPPTPFEVKAPKDAPNVVIVLIDDARFCAPSTFRGPIRTPMLDQLAENELRFNNLHTTTLCSPTRNALKTGRNHHTYQYRQGDAAHLRWAG